MKKRNILVVSHVDDNFGDNLIRICFGRILSVVLQNLGLDQDKVTISYMALKEIDEAFVKNADIIAFAGGGLFGLSYLNFFDSLDRITLLAEEHQIPVIFSSIGINNMDVSTDNEHKLRAILQRKCIKAVSVRENLHIFREYAGQCDYEICKVCDPAVWTKYVYHSQLDHLPSHPQPLVGINVVRGGL
ncbi:MAG: polysaccharide pyruvyl transferase family protein, partial [Clostridia bacterium]|nr:polysaccharide pyruvyl transferase family protein [Clostridia bacterium]